MAIEWHLAYHVICRHVIDSIMHDMGHLATRGGIFQVCPLYSKQGFDKVVPVVGLESSD